MTTLNMAFSKAAEKKGFSLAILRAIAEHKNVATNGKSERIRGLSSELTVLQIYGEAFPGSVIVAERGKENQLKDIDARVTPPGGDHAIPVSIKDQTRAYLKYGNLSFELEVFFAPKGEWQPGNAALCQAEIYLFLLGSSVYTVSVQAIKSIAANPNHGFRIANLSSFTIQSQKAMKHPHTNARNLLIPFSYLVSEGIAKKIN